jgi:hypothetical protein
VDASRTRTRTPDSQIEKDRARYRTPGPGIGMVSLTKAPVTYNPTLDCYGWRGGGSNLGNFSPSPTPFVSGAAPPHPLSLSDKPWCMSSKTFGSLCSPRFAFCIVTTRASSTTNTTTSFSFSFFLARGFPPRREQMSRRRESKAKQSKARQVCGGATTGLVAVPVSKAVLPGDGYFRIKKGETDTDTTTRHTTRHDTTRQTRRQGTKFQKDINGINVGLVWIPRPLPLPDISPPPLKSIASSAA